MDDEPDFLDSLETKILQACPRSYFDKATTYKEAVEMMLIWTYDLILLNPTLPRIFDLLERAIIERGKANFPVVIITAKVLSREALALSLKNGANAYMPKDRVGKVVPFLEEILRYENLPRWRRLLEDLHRVSAWRRKNGHKAETKFLRNFFENMDELKRNGLF